MKILILSNWSDNIAELNALTEPNKQAYAEKHGYAFENVKMDYTPANHVKWLEIIRERLANFDIVMTVGCDVLFMNQMVKIEDKIYDSIVLAIKENRAQGMLIGDCHDSRVVIAREHISWWPINNDVMIWPKGTSSDAVLIRLIQDAKIWLQYPWLWQAHFWDLIQTEPWVKHETRIVEAREMNSTFQPFLINNGLISRLPGPSSWQFGDWILHALDMPPEMRLHVIKWALQFVGDATYASLPKDLTGAK